VPAKEEKTVSRNAVVEEVGSVRRPMRPRVVRLVDVGLDERFDASMSFVQATLRNINAGAASPIVEVEFVRSRDLLTVSHSQ
jgi:hypothetical protein